MALTQFVAIVCLLVAAVSAMPDGYGANREIHHSQDGHNFKFGYNIADHHTGDNHGRHEVGHGGHHVSGNYYLHDPYGYVRSVDYVSDDHGGTRQHVHGSPFGLYVHTPFYTITPKGKHY